MDEWWRKAYKREYQEPKLFRLGARRGATPTPTYNYSPLDPTVDCIRLVILEPSWEQGSPIKCRIRHAAFKDKPRYESLSYAWGKGMASEKISIDGETFLIGHNLFLALRHLREDTNERVLWLDAISINQADVQERNKQISIMPYIYARAQRVLVWLGMPLQALIETRDVLPDHLEQAWKCLFFGYEINTAHSGVVKVICDDLLTAMCNEWYWTRLWIIQEISLARRVLICYGDNTVEWDAFIEAIKASDTGLENSVPMILQLQLNDKYRDGHKLHRLLENHQTALCKEPRDHVYGLVGLASDCINPFPIDYEKSLFEVWKDTVLYMNSNYNASHHDIMKFGKLVRKLFGEPDIALEGEVTKDLATRMAAAPAKKDSLRFTTRLVGRICFLGPTYHEIIADLRKTAVWKANIHRYTQDEHLPAAMEESDIFLELLEGIEDDDLEMVAPFDLKDLWKVPETEETETEPDIEVAGGHVDWNNSGGYTQRDESEWSIANQVEGHAMPNPSGDRQLFLLDLPNRRDDSPGSMGLAPPNAAVGDLVLQVLGVERALVVRREEGAKLSVVGTAVLAENWERGRASREKAAGKEFKIGMPDFTFRESDAVELAVDVALAYHLLVR